MIVAASAAVTVLALQAIGLAVPSTRIGATTASLVILCALGVFFAVRASQQGNRTAWLLVAAAQIFAAAADLLLRRAPTEGTSVLFWAGSLCGIGMYTAFAGAAVLFPAQRLGGWQRAALAGEAVAVLGCGFMYVWYFVLQHKFGPTTDWSRWPLTVGFPLGDLLLLIGVSVVVLRGGLSNTAKPVALYIAGLSVFLVADEFFNAIGADGDHSDGPVPATVSVVAALACVAYAAIWQSLLTARHPATPASARRWAPAWFSYLPYAAVGASLALMVAVTIRDNQLKTWGGLVLGLTVVTAGVAVRQIVSLTDSRKHETVDALTGLTNRIGLDRRLNHALRRNQPVGLLLIDLDGFKAVNDTYGHGTGDQLLLEFAATLRANTRGSDLACRIGGDEFVVLQHGVTGDNQVNALARRIQTAAAARPIRADQHTITAKPSIGAALSTTGDDPDQLRHRADIAMYQAKRAPGHDPVLYQPGMLDRRADDAALGRDLEAAVDSGQLRVLFQPIINLATGTPIGAEALVRWHHPVRGLVSPLDFIPIAERTGAITGVGLYVLEQACRDVQTWPGTPYVSVNLSARQLQDPTLAASVTAVLDRTGLTPGRLVLEITESAIVDDRVAIPALQALREHGIRIAVDDFGTGYSSLQYLNRLPIDILKIDRSFVAELDHTGKGSAITEAVISLARILDLTTIAEGIETPDQATELQRLGCHTGQGFLYARPLDAGATIDYLTAAASRSATAPA